MAREINAELLDTKIEKAQKNLVKAKHRYDAAAATLKDLLDKRDALRQKKLLDAIAQSGRSYEEIMQYLHSKSAACPQQHVAGIAAFLNGAAAHKDQLPGLRLAGRE